MMEFASLNVAAAICLAYTGLARLAEIALGEINAKALLAKGGREFAPEQRLPVFILYAGWMAALLLLTPGNAALDPIFLTIFALFQLLRWWAMAHLKGYWTTRIVIMPLAWRVTTGPYRFFSHPIYVALLGEVVALPLAFSQPLVALAGGGLMGLWLAARIRAENRALSMML